MLWKFNKLKVSRLIGKHLDPVVQRLNNAIWRINRYPLDRCSQTNHSICWKMIYPVDSFIHLLNKSGLVFRRVQRFS